MFNFVSTILSVIVLIITPIKLLAQGDESPLVTQLEIQKADTTFLHQYLYDSDNNITVESVFFRQGNNWTRKAQTEWVYLNKICTDQYFRRWDGTEWRSYFHINSSFPNQTTQLDTYYSIDNGVTSPIKKIEREYENKLLLSEKTSTFTGNNWQLSSTLNQTFVDDRISEITLKAFSGAAEEQKLVYHYNADNLADSLTIYQKSNGAWEKSLLSLTVFQSDKSRKWAEITKTWNPEYALWQNTQQIEFEYDEAGRLISENYQFWGGAFWKNQTMYRYEYNPEGELTKKTNYLPFHNDYRLASSITYSDFKNGKANYIESNYEFWGNGENGSALNAFISFRFNNEIRIKNASKITLRYTPIDYTDIRLVQEAKIQEIKIYPNPSRGIFYFSNEAGKIKEWSVYDLSGKKLKSQTPKENSGIIDISDYEKGAYILKTIGDDGVKMGKLIKE